MMKQSTRILLSVAFRSIYKREPKAVARKPETAAVFLAVVSGISSHDVGVPAERASRDEIHRQAACQQEISPHQNFITSSCVSFPQHQNYNFLFTRRTDKSEACYHYSLFELKRFR